jgi:hypothetical protein
MMTFVEASSSARGRATIGSQNRIIVRKDHWESVWTARHGYGGIRTENLIARRCQFQTNA